MSAVVILPDVSDAARRLQWTPDSVAMETDLARAPVFAAGGSASTQYALPGPAEAGSLHFHAFKITTPAGWPTTRDLLVLSDLMDRYVKMGCPESGLVPISGRELRRAAGYSAGGGRQFKEASDCLMRLAFNKTAASRYNNQ